MSLDYTKTENVSMHVPSAAAIANATVVVGYIGSQQNWGVLALTVTVQVAATSATQTVKLQASDSAGSFASPVDLCEITLASTDAAGTVLFDSVDAASFDLTSGHLLRVVHIATSTDASAKYRADVTVTQRHC